MISTLAVAGYRSLRELHVALGRLTVVTGANGAGKSSLYRSLRLLADCARGGVVSSLAREGGLPSVLWAGPGGSTSGAGGRRRGPVSVRVGYASDGFGYLADLGLPSGDPGQSAFTLDPEVKRELVWAGPVLRPAATLLQRHGPAVQVRGDSGGFEPLVTDLASFESALAVAGDPARTPEVLAVRDQVRSWRFYDTFRTDAAAPARTVQIGTRTLALADDGSDLAAALQTIAEIGVAEELDACVDDAFPGSRLQVVSEGGRFDLTLHQPGLLRPLRTARAVRRDPALPVVGGGPAEPSSGRAGRLQRAGDQPAPRPAARPGAAHHPRGRPDPGRRRHPRRPARRPAGRRCRHHRPSGWRSRTARRGSPGRGSWTHRPGPGGTADRDRSAGAR